MLSLSTSIVADREVHRLLLADDHGLILEGLRSMLTNDFDVVGVASNGRELVTETERLRPDAVLLDLSMPILNGMDAARQIKSTVPEVKLVFVTQSPIGIRAGGPAQWRIGICAEAVGCQRNRFALREVLAGRYYVTPELRASIPEILSDPLESPTELFGEGLTPRQRQVLQLVAEGKSNKEIANLLSVSVETVDFHKSGIMQEVGLRTTAELTRYAIEHGIIGG